MPHNLDRTDVDLDTLAADLTQRLGRPVDLLVQPPQTVTEFIYEDTVDERPVIERDADGRPFVARTERVVTGRQAVGTRKVQVPGQLVVYEKGGNEADVDGRTVAAAVRAHVPPPTPAQRRAKRLADAEAKAKAGDTAGALADVLALLRADTPTP